MGNNLRGIQQGVFSKFFPANKMRYVWWYGYHVSYWNDAVVIKWYVIVEIRNVSFVTFPLCYSLTTIILAKLILCHD